jgi:hypothetical protein
MVSHTKWYLNIFEIVTKLKPIGKCCNVKFIDFFLLKKSDQLFHFHIYFSQLCKISN